MLEHGRIVQRGTERELLARTGPSAASAHASSRTRSPPLEPATRGYGSAAWRRPAPRPHSCPTASHCGTTERRREACTACPLWRTGTQTVFGEGLKRARLMLVGEQPGDREDLAGRPFVGPAGRLLDEALAEAGIERGRRLPDERGQALQVGAARQAADPPEAEPRVRSPPAGRGSMRSSRSSHPRCSSASARPRRRRCSAATSASRAIAGGCSSRRSPRPRSRRYTPRRSCARRTRTRGARERAPSSTTSGSPRRRYRKVSARGVSRPSRSRGTSTRDRSPRPARHRRRRARATPRRARRASPSRC